MKENLREVQEISEIIGSAKSRAEYERLRMNLKAMVETFQKQIESEQQQFGDRLVEHYPKILVSRSVMLAKKKLKHKLDSETLTPGLNRQLVETLLASTECVCGEPLTKEAKDKLKHFLSLLPPNSYKSIYDMFTHDAESVVKAQRYDLGRHIETILDLKSKQRNAEDDIVQIDKDLKAASDIQVHVDRRRALEVENDGLREQLNALREKQSKLNLLLRKYKKDFEDAVASNDNNAVINDKIEIMTQVKEYFEGKLIDLARAYSKRLCNEIQKLLTQMLTTKRTVSISEDFLMRVFDNFGDEYKSEGQFAVVTFAYIGGIFRIIDEEKVIAHKEFPLVLDGPFSKLDSSNKQNVIDSIPNFAPQIILFSKDGLNKLFGPEKLGKTYVIKTNEYSNVAYVEEGEMI
jgi:uncharacterized protein YaaW (UPF0174 family)